MIFDIDTHLSTFLASVGEDVAVVFGRNAASASLAKGTGARIAVIPGELASGNAGTIAPGPRQTAKVPRVLYQWETRVEIRIWAAPAGASASDDRAQQRRCVDLLERVAQAMHAWQSGRFTWGPVTWGDPPGNANGRELRVVLLVLVPLSDVTPTTVPISAVTVTPEIA